MKITNVVVAAILVSTVVSAQDPCGTWGEVAVTNPAASTHTMLQEVGIVAPDDAWVVGSKMVSNETQTLAYHWNGTAWAIVATPSPTPFAGGGWADLQSVEAIASNNVWAAGGQFIQAPDGFVGTHILVEHWNGSQWSVVPAPMTLGGSGNFVDDIEAIAPNDIWFVGDWLEFPPTSAAEKRALAMHWNGSSFTVFPTPFFDNAPIGGHGLTAVSAVASNDVWAVGGGHDGDYVSFSYIVHWDGTQWQYRPGPTAGWDQRWYDVQAVAANDVWAVGDYEDAVGYHGLFAHWDGTAWTRLPDPPVGGSSIEVVGPGRVYVGGGGVALWNGAAWSVVASFPNVGSPSLMSLERIGPCAVWGAGRRFENQILPLTVRLDPVTGIAYCTAGTTTNNCVPTLSATGTPSASANSGFTISAAHLEGQKTGLLFYGVSGRAAAPWAAGSSSWLCVKAPTQRMSLQSTGGTYASCNGAFSQDWLAFVAAHPTAMAAPFSAGNVIDVQAWLRDPPAPKTTNLSNALEFVLQQ